MKQNTTTKVEINREYWIACMNKQIERKRESWSKDETILERKHENVT